jgi:hypothetical protein
MWGFGKVELIVNILFYDMYCQDANSVIVSFVLGNFDLRKKWRLLSNGLKRQKVKDYRQYSGKINELMDIRNSIAHGSFYEEPSYEGLYFENYVDKNSGKKVLPHKLKETSQDDDENYTITFDEFDRFDKQAAELFDYLSGLEGTLAPVTELDEQLETEIAEVMGVSENVIPFPKRTERTNRDTTVDE